jgi:hypothetical protein
VVENNKNNEEVNINTFICPLSKKLFQNPVFTADGFTFER